MLFAYTIKGWGLPIAGNPRNHSALLTDSADRPAARRPRPDRGDRVGPARPDDPRRAVGGRPPRAPGQGAARHDARARGRCPTATGMRAARPISTQEAFGRILVDLSRAEAVAPYLVTTAPDVATSTNLAGFINRTGVFSPVPRRSWTEDPVLKWAEGPTGQHIELGHQRDEPVPAARPARPVVGSVRISRCCRSAPSTTRSCCAAWTRSSTRSTPAPGSSWPARRPGVTLAPEGGAHQSTITASVGLELPNVTFIEPAYAGRARLAALRRAQSVAGRGRPPAGQRGRPRTARTTSG